MVDPDANRLFNLKCKVPPSREETVESVGLTLFEDARLAEQRKEEGQRKPVKTSKKPHASRNVMNSSNGVKGQFNSNA